MLELRTIALSLGIFWMIALWTWTSPFPMVHYFKNPLLPRRFLTSSIVLMFFMQLLGYFRVTFSLIDEPVVSYTGMLLYFIGIFLSGWAKFIMKRNWGEPGQHDIKRQSQLVITGPFSLSRNPIYVGLLLIFFGFELTVSSWLVVGIVPLGYLVHNVVKNEESLLENHFGNAYIAYKKRTPRFL